MSTSANFPIKLLYWGAGTEKNLDGKPHLHSFFQLEICRTGRIVGISANGAMALEQGEFWLIPPETPHSFRPSGTSASYYSVKFRAESSLRTAGRNGHPVADYHVNAIVRLLDDAGQTARLDFVSETILGQHLWCLLATLDADTGSGGQESPFLLRQKEFISHHGAAANVTRLAEEENMSLSQFKKHFRRESGGRTDIKRFIDELLIQCAVGHLIYSPGNLTEIARLMNFPTIYAFSRFFKSRTGVSPLEYRNRHRR